METNFKITLDEMLEAIEDFPYLRQCFSSYLKWLFEKCDENRRRYDAIYVKIATGANTLDDLENVFQKFGSIFNMSESDFCQAFRFDFDRNKNDILKLNDLLAEPWVALALYNLGFQEIRKVQTSTGKFSDFTANWNTTKFAIEVKNARNSDDKEFYKRRTDSLYSKEEGVISHLRARNGKVLSQQEEEIIPVRLERRLQVEKERQKIEQQLINTKEEFNCQATMLVIYLDMIVLLGEFPYIVVSNLEKVKANYSISDYFACCIRENLFCSPQLP
jgi:hypothetical protein